MPDVGVQRGVRQSALPLGRQVQRQTRRGARAWSWGAWRREGWPAHWKDGEGGSRIVTRHSGDLSAVRPPGSHSRWPLPPTRWQCFDSPAPSVFVFGG